LPSLPHDERKISRHLAVPRRSHVEDRALRSGRPARGSGDTVLSRPKALAALGSNSWSRSGLSVRVDTLARGWRRSLGRSGRRWCRGARRIPGPRSWLRALRSWRWVAARVRRVNTVALPALEPANSDSHLVKPRMRGHRVGPNGCPAACVRHPPHHLGCHRSTPCLDCALWQPRASPTDRTAEVARAHAAGVSSSRARRQSASAPSTSPTLVCVRAGTGSQGSDAPAPRRRRRKPLLVQCDRELELLQRRAYRDQREVRLVVARVELDRPLVQARPRAAVLADRDTQAGSPSRSVRPNSPLRRALARAAAGREEVALLTKRLVSLQQLVFRHLVRLSAAEVHIQRVAARARRGACVRDSIV
jgi:hypothetical protein